MESVTVSPLKPCTYALLMGNSAGCVIVCLNVALHVTALIFEHGVLQIEIQRQSSILIKPNRILRRGQKWLTQQAQPHLITCNSNSLHFNDILSLYPSTSFKKKERLVQLYAEAGNRERLGMQPQTLLKSKRASR